jgi:sugar lactone lactonase YvrE
MALDPIIPPTLRILATARNTLGEGAAWDEREQALWWVDIEQAAIQRFRAESGQYDRWELPERVTALALREQGGLVVALASGFGFFDPSTGALERGAVLAGLLPGHRLNDGRCDAAGRFWCAAMREVGEDADAHLYCLEADGSVTQKEHGLKVGNGLAWSPDSSIMYMSETSTGTIHAYDFDLSTGTMRNRRRFDQPEMAVPGGPDGGAVDAEGHFWSARWGGQGLARFDPDGRLERFIQLPAEQVTCCVFGGPDLRTLYVTSAIDGLDEAQRQAHPQAGILMAFEPGVAGLPTRRFAG